MVALTQNVCNQYSHDSLSKSLSEVAPDIELNDIVTTLQIPSTTSTTATTVADLAVITEQLAQVDQMLADVTASVPVEEEAKFWHDISLKALQVSHQMLSKKHAACCVKLRDAVAPPPGLEKCEKASKPEAPLETPSWLGWSKEQVEACAEFKPEISPLLSTGSLRNDLERLRAQHADQVIIVRKIKRLGFESQHLLEEYFKQYGNVSEVLVSHSHVKPTAKRPNGRVRPASLGFVLMSSEQDAICALQGGSLQVVNGVSIDVRPFSAFDGVEAEEITEQ